MPTANILIPRPDLATAEWTKPNLIGGKLCPTYVVQAKNGTLYYRTAVNTATVQSNRTAGAAVTSTNSGLGEATFSLVEKLCRRDRDVRQILPGSEDKAMMELARQGKTGVAYALEAMIAKIVLDTATATASASTTQALAEKLFLKNVKEGVQSLLSYGKKVAVVMSQKKFNEIKTYDAIKNEIGKFVTAPLGTIITPEDYAQIQLAGIFGSSAVMIGQNASWDNVAFTNNDAVAIVALPDQPPTGWIDLTLEPVFGIMAVEQGFTDGVETPFTCEQGFNPTNRTHFIDTVAFADELVLNTDLVKAVALPTVSA